MNGHGIERVRSQRDDLNPCCIHTPACQEYLCLGPLHFLLKTI